MEEINTIHTSESLSSLSREELRQQLAAQLQKDTSEINVALVALLRKELESRDPDPAFSDDTAVEVACEKFRRNTETAQKTKKHRYRNRWIVAASVVLVMSLLFFTLPATAQARDIQGVLTWWSDSVFQLFVPGKTPNLHAQVHEFDHPGLQQLHNVVTEWGVTDPIVPSWIPDGFELVELEKSQMQENSSLYARFVYEEQVILFLITFCANETKFQHEKDTEPINSWNFSGTEHYVLSNINEHVVTWVTNDVECVITTDCEEEDVYRMIKSIYTSEA